MVFLLMAQLKTFSYDEHGHVILMPMKRNPLKLILGKNNPAFLDMRVIRISANNCDSTDSANNAAKHILSVMEQMLKSR